MTRPPDLIYAVDENPPPAILVVSALQHIALMAITLIFPIICGKVQIAYTHVERRMPPR
jgi:hypothetical protein